MSDLSTDVETDGGSQEPCNVPKANSLTTETSRPTSDFDDATQSSSVDPPPGSKVCDDAVSTSTSPEASGNSEGTASSTIPPEATSSEETKPHADSPKGDVSIGGDGSAVAKAESISDSHENTPGNETSNVNFFSDGTPTMLGESTHAYENNPHLNTTAPANVVPDSEGAHAASSSGSQRDEPGSSTTSSGMFSDGTQNFIGESTHAYQNNPNFNMADIARMMPGGMAGLEQFFGGAMGGFGSMFAGFGGGGGFVPSATPYRRREEKVHVVFTELEDQPEMVRTPPDCTLLRIVHPKYHDNYPDTAPKVPTQGQYTERNKEVNSPPGLVESRVEDTTPRDERGKYITPPYPVEYTCKWCGKSSYYMLVCKGCKIARYCDDDCQTNHWVWHRHRCFNDPENAVDVHEGATLEIEIILDSDDEDFVQ